MSERPSTAAAPEANGAEPATAVVKHPDRTPLSRRDPVNLAEHFWKSGYFSDVKSMSQAVVKVVFGEELGLGVGASMRGIYIIEGRPSFSANVLATLIKRSEHYDYKVRESTEEKCSIEFFEDDESLGLVDFTIEQAQKIRTKEKGSWVSLAETLRWKNSPQDMLFARCLTRGERQHCPDVTGGHPAYTPEELGAETDAQGAPIQVDAEVVVHDELSAEAPVGLDDELVEHLLQGFELAGPELGGVTPLDGLNLTLGALGIDAFEPADDLRPQFAALTPEQADALNAELQKALDADATEEVDAEVVDERQDGGEAGADC